MRNKKGVFKNRLQMGFNGNIKEKIERVRESVLECRGTCGFPLFVSLKGEYVTPSKATRGTESFLFGLRYWSLSPLVWWNLKPETGIGIALCWLDKEKSKVDLPWNLSICIDLSWILSHAKSVFPNRKSLHWVIPPQLRSINLVKSNKLITTITKIRRKTVNLFYHIRGC
ncbi:hypothetical protein TNCV_3076741 [Trichonephila clavipes]|nr:hypothetical protein TNCV_3076741 [Trichonephila clavipes]